MFTIISTRDSGRDDPDAVEGTRQIIFQCVRMGFPFLKRNWQDKRLYFLVFHDEMSEIFENAWNLFSEEFSKHTIDNSTCLSALQQTEVPRPLQDSQVEHPSAGLSKASSDDAGASEEKHEEEDEEEHEDDEEEEEEEDGEEDEEESDGEEEEEESEDKQPYQKDPCKRPAANVSESSSKLMKGQSAGVPLAAYFIPGSDGMGGPGQIHKLCVTNTSK